MTTAPQFQGYLDGNYKNLDVNLEDISVPEPPTDDSHTTRMELEELEQTIQEAKLPREIMRVADRDPLRLFYSVAKKKGLDPLEEEAKDWADDWTKLSFEFKLKFKRRRPWEVKKEHDIDFVVNKSDTTESPSYPSGHAMMGYGVAEFYKDKYPLMADEWDNVAEIIAHSRLQMGVHYPSDVEASKKIVDQLVEQVKEASVGRFVRQGMKRTLQSGKGVKLTTKGGGKKVIGKTTPRYTRKKPTTPASAPATTAPATTAPAAPQTWGQRFGNARNSVGNFVSERPGAAAMMGVGAGTAGVVGANKLSTQPSTGMHKFNSAGHLEQRRSERAKFMSKEDLASLEKKVRRSKDLPEGAHYITLPHGRKGVVRTEEGKSHLATILDARMRPPGRDLTNIINSTSGHSKEARAFVKSLANMARFTPTGTALEVQGTRAAKKLYQGAQVGQRAAGKANAKLRQAYYSPEFLNANLAIQRNVNPATVADDVGNVINFFKGGSHKTAAEKLRLYHGSPHDLETLEPRQPNKGAWGEHGLYGTPNQLVAALYAIARNDSKGSWGILPDGRLIAKGKKELNPEGYVYEYDSDDYIPPPEDDPGIGYASQSSPEILSKEKVYLDKLRDSITRVDDRDKFLEYFKKTSSPRLRTTIFGVDPDGNLLHGFGGQGFYKFPGGGVDPGESIVDAAKRELLEEAGYEVDSIEELPGLDTSDSVGATSAKGHMGHGSSLTKYLLARLGKRNESLLGSEGDAISNLQTAPIDEVLGGLEGDMLFGSGVAESNHAALSRVRDMLQKTSAYKDYRPRGTLYLLDGKGGVMADKPTADYNSTTPYFFPGGGIFEEEKVDRLPTRDEIVEGVEREALEELGTKLKNVRVLQDEPANVDMPDWWRDRQKKKRGVDYKGIAEFFAAAERGDQDKSIYGADNDEFKGTFYPIDEVASALEANAKPGDDYYEDSMRQARLLRSLLEKTSSDQPLLRHRSTLLIRDPETGKLLAANSREDRNFNDVSPFYFPGGGLYEDEYDTPRTPTEEEILEGARREALEELGMTLKNPKIIGGLANVIKQKEWRDKALRRRGVPYEGGHEHLVLADKGDIDNSLYNVEGDAFTKGEYWDPQEVYDSLYEYGQQGGQFSAYNVEQARAIKDNLLKKNASDLSVLTAVPTQNLDMIMRKGLYSQKAMLDDPEVLAAFLAQRNADKAWKNDEQYDEKRFREQYDKRVALMEGEDAPLAGPSVFFTEPDPDKVSDPRHFVNKFDTQKLRVNLGKLLADIPETRITGAELIPSSAAENMSDEEFEQYVKDRRRDITPEEAAKYIATDPKELWKHYKDEYIGKYYAADVPHAFIRTPSGIIPPEYLERVEKTSSAKEQLKHILVTGHSGAGKTTYARQLAEELGIPLHRLDVTTGPIMEAEYPEYWDKGTLGYPEDVSTRVIQQALDLDKPHVIEGSHILEIPELTEGYKRVLIDTPEDRVVEQRAQREYRNQGRKGKPYRPIEKHREAAQELVDHYRDIVTNFRNQPGVESIVPEVKQAALEDEFQPDLTPDDLKALGVYDQVYGDAPSEASMKEWPEHWINPQDPLGWLQWYDRYSEGRRTDDDERQMKRWKSFKARHLAQYLNKPTPRRAAALRNWGIDVGKY